MRLEAEAYSLDSPRERAVDSTELPYGGGSYAEVSPRHSAAWRVRLQHPT